MTVYAVGQLTVSNREVYARYQARFMEVFRRFKGSLLAAHENPKVIEGQWDHRKLILISFPDEDAFREWFESAAYQEIAKDRKAGASAVIILAQAFA